MSLSLLTIRMTKIKRRFIPGDEWVYYKIYCGPKTADDLLTGCINSGIRELLDLQIIQRWFFLRYSDPDLHLRIRFLLTDNQHVNDLINGFNSILEPFVKNEMIHNVQMDTYVREIERYGDNTMEYSEEMFCFDSELTIDVLEHLQHESDSNLIWMFVLRSIDALLEDFKYGLARKAVLLEQLRNNFAAEFNMERYLKRQLDQKYRNFKEIIFNFLGNKINENETRFRVEELLKQRSHKSQKVVKKILEEFNHNTTDNQLDAFMSSHIHMTMNRAFRTRQRMHEMVLYDFLFRYYKSELAKLKHKNAV